MDNNNYTMFLGGRGISKTYTTAAFCVERCLLYPGTVIAVASGNRKQASLVIKKIVEEFMPGSANLRAEVKDYSLSPDKAFITFYNDSSIQIVTARDSARGCRANILIIDEFRMVSQTVMQTVLRKFLTAPRHPGFLDLPEYKGKKKLYQERNKEIYMSSAWYCSHWSYEKCKDYAAKMLSDKLKYFVSGLPYQLAIKEGLLVQSAVEDEMSESDFNELTWAMEMECMWIGDFTGGFFEYPVLEKARVRNYPMLPSSFPCKLAQDKHFAIPPKEPLEKRLLSVDIALMASKKAENDASAIIINQMLPNNNGKYISNIVFTDAPEGLLTSQQALQIRRLYEEFECDYIIIDSNGVGLGVYDALAEDIVDPDTGEIYPALSCCNDEKMAERCVSKGADKVIWSVKASAQFNSDCALMLREGFKSGKIKLLISEYDSESVLDEEIKGYRNLSIQERSNLTKQYIDTSFLINELINLDSEEVNGKIKVKEKSGMRKDRYSSLSYNYYVACQLEADAKTRRNSQFSAKDIFKFRAPIIK
jgi:hypothetical protein